MTIQLTTEQWGNLQQQAEHPVPVCDPSQREQFVLLRAEVYDPAMDVYDDLDPRRTS